MNNIGIIGNGKWAKIMIPLISKLSNIRFIANSKIDYKKLNLKNISWIFVLTNNETHYKIVRYFLNKKKNVFCEKPLAKSYSQVLKLYNISKKQKVKLYVNDVEFFKKKNFVIKKTNKILRIKRSLKDENSLLHRLAYHDFYLLKRYIILNDIKIIKNVEKNNELKLKIMTNDKCFEFFYDINSKIKVHKINKFDMMNFRGNPLKKMIKNIYKINKKKLDINKSNTIFASKLISTINNKFS